jgi:hypothetical protein
LFSLTQLLNYLPCCQQYPLLEAARLHLVPFFVVALHCESLDGWVDGDDLEVGIDFFSDFGGAQTPQVPPPRQYLQELQLEHAEQ